MQLETHQDERPKILWAAVYAFSRAWVGFLKWFLVIVLSSLLQFLIWVKNAYIFFLGLSFFRDFHVHEDERPKIFWAGDYAFSRFGFRVDFSNGF